MIQMDQITAQYNPKETEEKIYNKWLKSGLFNPDNLPGDRKEPYTILIAPPNVTGSLHMGHALENTISDVLIRFHRMKGYKTLWLPGTDHAGIATQNVVEKDLKKQGLSRHDLGREKFLEKIWEWKDKYGDIILNQLKTLGCSCDWSRTRFTMDKDYQEAVKTAFENYHQQGLIYRGERVINWCVKDQTALSDLELEYVEEEGIFYYLKYGPFIITTARPETKFGDKYVVMHPDDTRYQQYEHGEKISLEWINGPVTATVIKDKAIDMNFGTGVMTITPYHDIVDFEIAERHKLDGELIIDKYGKLLPIAGKFAGLKISEARSKIVEKLRAKGLIEKEEKAVHNVAKCYRCNSTVEPMMSKQWFLKMAPLAKKVLTAIKNGEVAYYPERWTKVAVDWLENVRDWCISRQIWWGHPIPIADSTDTFDTWFSSALWPLATLGWPKKTKDLSEFYPTQVITSARDIIHLWISRMLFSGLEFTNKLPFSDVVIHATILTKDGRRMSKSLGTGIDPMEMINKYGADATRFGLLYQSFEGQEMRFNENILITGKKFCNKLWNISRYVVSAIDDKKSGEIKIEETKLTALTDADKLIISALNKTVTEVEAQIKNYNFGQATHFLYDFVWRDLADKYIEESKKQLLDPKLKENTGKILATVLLRTLKIIHPVMPFITETIWEKINQSELLLVAKWPTLDKSVV